MAKIVSTVINHHARNGNIADYNRLKDRVYDMHQSSLNHYNHSSLSITPPSGNMTTSSTRSVHPFGTGMPPTAYAQGIHIFHPWRLPRFYSDLSTVKPNFKDSPFYSITEPLTPVLECKGNPYFWSCHGLSYASCTHEVLNIAVNQSTSVREATRDQLEAKINLRQDVVDRLLADSSQRVMIYCASEPVSPFSQVDITFPHQIEIRVNLDEVKANLRGLKGKPGSTRPADITPLLRKRAGYENTLNVTYALTNKVCVLPCFKSTSLILFWKCLLLNHGSEILCCGQPCETKRCRRPCYEAQGR